VGDLTWYDELRACYRPEHLRILLIGESPPDAGAGERHLFYAPTLSRYDNLYGGVTEALYGEPGPFNLTDKAQTLQAPPSSGPSSFDDVRRCFWIRVTRTWRRD
jgi:hypothetical protein